MDDQTLAGIGVLAAFCLYMTNVFWYRAANRPWSERVLGRKTPSMFGEMDMREAARYVRDAPDLTVGAFRALRIPSDDPETERLRVLTMHRAVIALALIPSVLLFPLLTVLVGRVLSAFVGLGFAAFAIVCFECLLLARWAWLAALLVHRYGNGQTLNVRGLSTAASGIAAITLVMLLQYFFVGRV